MKVKENVPLLTVSDIQKSHEFYCGVLGFEEVQQWKQDDKLAWCRLEHGGAALMLQQACEEDPSSESWGKGVHFYFICDDAEEAYRTITERGGSSTEPKVAFLNTGATQRQPDRRRRPFKVLPDSLFVWMNLCKVWLWTVKEAEDK